MITAEPRVERDLFDILSSALRLYRGRGQVLISLGLLWALPAFVIYRDQFLHDRQWLAVLLGSVSVYTAQLFVQAAMIHALSDLLSAGTPDVVRSLGAAASRFRSVWWTRVSTHALTLATLPFMPFFYIRWFFTSQSVMIDGKTQWAARDNSALIVAGYWWRTATILLVIWVSEWIWLFVVLAIFPTQPSVELAVAVWVGLQALTMPFVVAAQTLLYFDLVARRRAYEFWATARS